MSQRRSGRGFGPGYEEQPNCGHGDMWQGSMTTQAEFFLAHQVDGQLTDEQTMEMLNLPEGDTGGNPDSGTPEPATAPKPADTPVETDDKKVADEPTPADTVVDDAAKPEPTPVLLAKDGVHTIDYQKLVDAREGEKHWKAHAETVQQQLDALQAQAAERAEAGAAPTKTDNAVATATAAIEQGVDPEIFGDFSEADLAKGIQKLVLMKVEEATAPLRAELAKTVEPLKAQQALTAEQAHYKTIYDAHPDADSMLESAELASWIAKQPSIVRGAYEGVLKEGTAEQVVEVFTAFKDSKLAKTPAPPSDDGVTAAAKAAIAAAKSPAPTSLSEIPAGSAAHHDEAAAMLEMSSTSLLNKFDGKTPQQIAEMMDRVL